LESLDRQKTSAVAPSWYALQVRSQFEKTAVSILSSKGYETFLPLYRSQRIWSDRKKELELPLFPGYLFCKIDLENSDVRVITTAGVIAIIGYGRNPVAIDEGEVQALQRVIETQLEIAPAPFYQVGDRVRIEQGPLAGIEGILVSVKNTHRLVISITLLRRSVSVEVDSFLTTISRSCAESARSPEAPAIASKTLPAALAAGAGAR
jgi:transcription antitermination factor NusG